jgi:myo-inositol-1(or 4)-monophosphatase
MSQSEMKELLIFALKEAGIIQKQYFEKVHQIQQKESISSIVTEVDLLCDKAIVENIWSNYPDHNILSEEGGFKSKNSEYTWIIDPLDGTSNFAAGIPWFGVLIALVKNNIPVLAGAYLPFDEKLYLAESGKGTLLNDRKLRMGSDQLKNVLFGFSTDFSEDINMLEQGLKYYRFLIQNTRNIRSTNSLVDMMLVAEGKLGGVLNMYTKIWDIAAPWLIIKEAGGEFILTDGKSPDFTTEDDVMLRNYSIITGSVSLLEEFRKKQS